MIGTGTTIFLVNPTTFGSAFENNYSLSFDGVDEYVDCGYVSELDNASNLSFSFWMKLDDVTRVDRLFRQYQDSTNRWVEINSNGSGEMNFIIKGSSNGYGSTTTASLANNTWYHVVGVFDGSGATDSDKLKVYVNGSSQTISYTGTVQSTSADYTTTPSFDIARGFTGGSGYRMLGKLDEFAIFDYSLTSGQVTSIYNSGTPTDLDNTSGVTAPVHWWRMGDGSDTISTINDVGTTGGNDGTPTNMEAGDIVSDTP